MIPQTDKEHTVDAICLGLTRSTSSAPCNIQQNCLATVHYCPHIESNCFNWLNEENQPNHVEFTNAAKNLIVCDDKNVHDVTGMDPNLCNSFGHPYVPPNTGLYELIQIVDDESIDLPLPYLSEPAYAVFTHNNEYE